MEHNNQPCFSPPTPPLQSLPSLPDFPGLPVFAPPPAEAPC